MKKKYLVVDDEPLIRRALARAIVAQGDEVIEAADGAEGLLAWMQHKPDFVFLDVLMPQLTGPQVIQEKKDKGSAKVIMMSAFTGQSDVQNFYDLGADLFVSKPFDDIFAILAQVKEIKS